MLLENLVLTHKDLESSSKIKAGKTRYQGESGRMWMDSRGNMSRWSVNLSRRWPREQGRRWLSPHHEDEAAWPCFSDLSPSRTTRPDHLWGTVHPAAQHVDHTRPRKAPAVHNKALEQRPGRAEGCSTSLEHRWEGRVGCRDGGRPPGHGGLS